MGRIYDSITELVGNTPLVRLHRYEEAEGLKGHILAKFEYFNPSGSVKDRAAINMIEEAEYEGKLKPGMTIVDFTSGNTGIATATYANAKGYKYVAVIQPQVSVERSQILKALGAELLQVTDVPGFPEMLKTGLSLAGLGDIMNSFAKSKGWFYIDQCSNPANVRAHINGTGPEIWRDTDGNVDIFVSSVGTGGTCTGTGLGLREKNPDVKIVAVEPASSPVLSGGKPGPHKIQGIGAGFIPKVMRMDIVDEVITVENEAAFEKAREVAKSDGLLVGISSGAAIYAATELAKRPENKGKNIVVLLPDTGERYLSTQLFTVG